MTGYGRAEQTIGERIFLIEIKSLNGKQFDLRMLTPSILKPYEIEIRNIINEGLERGSVECMFNIKYNGANKPVTVNTELLKAYYTSVKQVADELQASDDNLLSAILRLPDVVTNSTDNLIEEEFKNPKKIREQEEKTPIPRNSTPYTCMLNFCAKDIIK